MRQPSNHTNKRKDNRPDNIKSWTVKEDGTILEVATSILKDHSPTKIKSMLRHNQFAINNMPTSRYDAEVHAGDTFSVNFDQSFQVFKNPRVELVYEDEHILVINKGYGLLSMGTDTKKDGTAYSIMREYVKYHDPRAKLFIVHRLDRDTSGIIAVAKKPETKGFLQKQFQERHAHKIYYAIVEGEPKQSHAIISVPLTRNLKYPTTFIPDPDGREAITEYKVLESKNGLSLIELKPKTGRTHQLRIHMNYIGCPILGDKVYNLKGRKADRMYLHAASLEITIPGKPHNERKIFKADLPAEFNKYFETK